MRTTFAGAAMAAALAWAGAVTPALVGTAGIVALSGPAAQAYTAIQPGWRHSCGRNPRCFERFEARRWASGFYLRYRSDRGLRD
jgi:hypothetical protein